METTQNNTTHYCVIRVPHQMPATIHFDVPARKEVTQEMLDEYNMCLCDAMLSNDDISDSSEYVPTDTMDINGWNCQVGDYVPDSFWHDAHDCIIFDSEQEMRDYVVNESNRAGHQWVKIFNLISSHLS